MDISKITYVFRAIGINGIIRTIRYGFIRDRIEKQVSKPVPEIEIKPGDLIRTTPIDSGIQLEYEHAQAELLFLSPNLIRISWEPGKSPVPYTIKKRDWPNQHTIITEKASSIELRCGTILAIINRQGGIQLGSGSDNIFKIDDPPSRIGKDWSISTILAPEEHIYGLGERASHFNLRPGKYTSWNTDIGGKYSHGKDPLYIGTPVYLSLSDLGCYLVYFENSFPSTFTIADKLNATFKGGMLRYYVITGSLDLIFKQYAELTGFPFMPPRWALGYHQSRWSYQSESVVYSIIDGFKKNDLPLSAIHLDIDYMDGFRLFTFDRERFHNIRKLTQELAGKGIRVVASVNPAIKLDPNYPVYNEGLSKDVYCKLPDGQVFTGVSWPGWSVFPDFTNVAARTWWQAQYPLLLGGGIAGIWHDMNEPASFAAWGDKSFPFSTLHSMESRGGDHLEAHNIYGLLMNQAGYEALQDYSPSTRPWILTRAGWAGVQRYAWSWTGDVETSWEALKQTIPTILGLNLSGHGFSGVDIGGFSGSPSAELYLRWFQLATFLPFFRTHSAVGTQPREPWVFGESVTSIIRKFLKLRYKLLPYLYTLAWSSTKNGIPPIRPIFWINPIEKSLWEVEDEFLCGDSILVAPVVHPTETIRNVILPTGAWYSFWDDELFKGPKTVSIPLKNDEIPLFIKGGTLLPLDNNNQLTFHIYPGDSEKTSSIIYSDRGDGYETFRVDSFAMLPGPSTLEITWSKTGDFPFTHQKLLLELHGRNLVHAMVDGSAYPVQSNSVIIPVFEKMLLTFE